MSTPCPALSRPRRIHGVARPYSKRIRSSVSTSTSPSVQVTERISWEEPSASAASPSGPGPWQSSPRTGMSSVTTAVPVGERQVVSSTMVPGR